MQLQALYSTLPEKSGIYIFKDSKGKVLYVGKAKDLKKRVASYFTKSYLEEKTQRLVENISTIEHIITTSEIEAFLLEANYIKKYRPLYNIKLSDDKFFPYVKISGEVPSVVITRRLNEKRAEYFGPYPNVSSLKIVLKLIRRIFPFESTQNHPKGKCFYNHLNLCPCASSFPEKIPEYKKNIRNLKKFLQGKKNDIVMDLIKEREVLAKNEEYEKAAALQEKIAKIELVTSENYDPFEYQKDPELYFNRIEKEKTSLVEFLRNFYPQLEKLERIECYDISNIQGKQATASMVVLTNGDIDKSQYRRFKIRTKDTPDDFFMMQEVLRRRLKRHDWKTPDLFVIDGGKGQISAVVEVFSEMNVSYPLIGLAKREEIIVIPRFENGVLRFEEGRLPMINPGLNLLRRIRDEAHRFALSYHRLLRKKTFLSS